MPRHHGVFDGIPPPPLLFVWTQQDRDDKASAIMAKSVVFGVAAETQSQWAATGSGEGGRKV